MTQLNVVKMAQELGLRPDALRIKLGIPTFLQREIRRASSHAELVTLGYRLEDSGYRSCGPKFEPEEKEEYWSKREELFKTILEEQFSSLDSLPESIYPFSEGEQRMVADRCWSLIEAEISSTEGFEEKLFLISSLIRAIKHPQAIRWISASGKSKLTSIAREIIGIELRRAENMDDVLRIFSVVEHLEEESHRFSRLYDQRYNSDEWGFVWELAQTTSEIAPAPLHLPEELLRSSTRKTRFLELLKEEFGPRSFAKVLVYARSLKSKDDGIQYDKFTTDAFIYAARLIKTRTQAKKWLVAWEERVEENKIKYEEHRTISSRLESIDIPREFLHKWDILHQDELSVKKNLDELKAIRDSSPRGSVTGSLAERKMADEMRSRLSSISNQEELDIFTSECSFYGIHGFYLETQEMRERFALQDAVLRAGVTENKKSLIGVYHDLKDERPDVAREVLLKLTSFYPAEEVDVLPESVEVS